MIEIRERTYVWAQWVVEFEIDVPGNWMACLLRQEGEPPELLYRFRYYVDDKLGEESEDERNWYRVAPECASIDDAAEVDALASQLEKAADMIAALTAARYGSTVQKTPVHRSGMDAAEIISTAPSMHVRKRGGGAA
jgi:hypothetical protein